VSERVGLTIEQAMEIRRLYDSRNGGAGVEVLASRYGVSVTTIRSILAGTHWSVRGAPNISGRRDVIAIEDAGWGGTSAGLTPVQKRNLAGKRIKSQREYRLNACPRCRAKPGEHCVNMQSARGSWTRVLPTVHRERRF
jgi:hypothetical protein